MNIVSETDASYLPLLLGQDKTATYSQYKKTEVKALFLEALRQGKVENSCYWCAELVAAGHYLDVWELFFLVLGKYIHHGNPLLVQYYRRRYELFRAIMHEDAKMTSMDESRNNVVLRKLFAEMAATVALAEKSPSYEEVTLPSSEDMMAHMMQQLQADHGDYATRILREKDPRELHIPVNELVYHLTVTHHMHRACYWVEWVLAFTQICLKKGEPLFCEQRKEYEGMESKRQKDTVWLLWESLVLAGERKKERKDTMVALLELFRIRFAGAATIKKRKHMLYFAVSLLTDSLHVVYPSELVSDKNKEIIRVATENIADIYTTLRQNAAQQEPQQQPQPQQIEGYRHMEKRQNLKDSMEKWDKVGTFDPVQKWMNESSS